MSGFVTALKSYGQHFLNDKIVLEEIVKVIKKYESGEQIIEIGPGTGALTRYLVKEFSQLTCIEVDHRCVEYLEANYNKDQPTFRIIEADFLHLDLRDLLHQQTGIVGNFPYNISSQIVFKVLEHYKSIPFMVGMFQKEMAERIASPHGSKEYGVISVLAQLLYDIKVEFDIAPKSFSPPPKVNSSILSLKRKENVLLDFDVTLFRKIVKAGFNQRRKMLRNGLSGLVPKEMLQQEIFQKRAEQLSLQDFIDLTKLVEKHHE
ncbi:MAG: ribosomal RNA small subunit methyltransferase A [Sphingobacteriales bacterium]|nr:ribosomal RNA small subunit methyltransferase A [Sphingobacteriales bacterium]